MPHTHEVPSSTLGLATKKEPQGSFFYSRLFYFHNLALLKFAVVDIETTGLFHQGHGITEIAVVLVENGAIKPVFHSMVNPGTEISSQISQLTGIDHAMVEKAPSINSLIPEIKGHLDGRIFLAHNVNFDYQFLKAAFEKEDEASA